MICIISEKARSLLQHNLSHYWIAGLVYLHHLYIIFRQDELPSSDMIVFKEGDNIGVSKLLTFYRKEPFYIQAEYADPLVVPCANPVIGKN